QQRDVLGRVGAFWRAEQLEHLVRSLDALAHDAPRPGKVAEVAHAQAAAAVFVLVRRTDAPTRRADLVTPLARPVQELVIGQWGYSPLDQVTPANVKRLVPVWTFSTGTSLFTLAGVTWSRGL